MVKWVWCRHTGQSQTTRPSNNFPLVISIAYTIVESCLCSLYAWTIAAFYATLYCTLPLKKVRPTSDFELRFYLLIVLPSICHTPSIVIQCWSDIAVEIKYVNISQTLCCLRNFDGMLFLKLELPEYFESWNKLNRDLVDLLSSHTLRAAVDQVYISN